MPPIVGLLRRSYASTGVRARLDADASGPAEARAARPAAHRRRRRSLLEVGEAGAAIAEHLLAAPEVRRAATVAAYVSVGSEPGTGRPARRAARRSGKRVILPVLLPDLDLDWAVYDGPDSLAARPPRAARAGRAAARRSTRSPAPTWCWSRGSRCDRTGDAAGPRRRLLRPGAGPGPGRHVRLRAALRRRGRSTRCPPRRPTTGAVDRRSATPAGHHAGSPRGL